MKIETIYPLDQIYQIFISQNYVITVQERGEVSVEIFLCLFG